MATHTTLNSLFTDIADAIRNKKDTTDTIIASNFPDEILSIPTGSANIEHILYAKESGANDSVHIAQMNNTTYGKYSDYLSYSSSTRKYTVLKDCALFFIPIVRNYNSSSSQPEGELWYNDARVSFYKAGTSLGSTGKGPYHRDCTVGDTFYCKTPSSFGWPEQRLHVYLMPNEEISQKFDEINNTNS